MTETHVFERVAIIGLGLIGSSIARAVHEKKIAKTVVGCDQNEISMAYAKKHGFLNEAIADPLEAIEGANLIVLATPPSSLAEIAEAIAPGLKPGMVVMDVCSVKESAIEAISPFIPGGVHFIPAHPIAGSEHSSVAAGRSDLFNKKRVIVTPIDPKLDFALQNVTSFWQAMGARCEAMPAPMHDLIYGYVSHLPQLLAFAAIDPLDQYDEEEDDELLNKFLRISASDPDMWIDIFIMNKENVLKALSRYLDVVAHIMNEFDQAPGDEKINEEDEKLARRALFPRVAASCLVTTVMEAEKQAGFSFARYAGTGFADFTYPASQPPEGDIESISNQYKQVGGVLREYVARLKQFHDAINSGEEHLFSGE